MNIRLFKQLALATCMTAALTACELKESYHVQNAQDLVSASSATEFLSDYGVLYTVTSDLSDRKWSVGNRYLIVFDIENSSYEITLKSYAEAVVSIPQEADWEERTPGDPVMVDGHTASGGYLNLQISFYRLKGGNYPHSFSMQYKDNVQNGALTLYLHHDGNGENPLNIDEDSLEKATILYSFKLAGLLPEGTSRTLYLVLDELEENATGDVLKENTYNLYDQQITF